MAFSSLVGVWSSGKRLLSLKETAADGKESESLFDKWWFIFKLLQRDQAKKHFILQSS